MVGPAGPVAQPQRASGRPSDREGVMIACRGDHADNADQLGNGRNVKLAIRNASTMEASGTPRTVSLPSPAGRTLVRPIA